MIEVLKPGLLSTLQDRGRHGHAGLGVGSAGAMDRVSARLANALVGNDADAALIEMTLAGPLLRFHTGGVIALCGAELDARLDEQAVPMWRPLPVAAGSVLDCQRLHRGARSYLAVAGGITVTAVLGSRSSDLHAAIGPLGGRALRTGDRLPLVEPEASHRLRVRTLPNWSLNPSPWLDLRNQRPLRLLPGTHFSALDPASRAALTSRTFRVANESNRVGLRLDGPALHLSTPLELVSASVSAGTVQLPPGGQVIVLGPEHPTTGGYPRIAHVIAVDLPRLGQCRPGDALVFVMTDTSEADALRTRHEYAMQCIEATIRARLTEFQC